MGAFMMRQPSQKLPHGFADRPHLANPATGDRQQAHAHVNLPSGSLLFRRGGKSMCLLFALIGLSEYILGLTLPMSGYTPPPGVYFLDTFVLYQAGGNLLSVREVVESDESFVIQGWRPDSRRSRRCGCPKTAQNTIVTNCAIRAI